MGSFVSRGSCVLLASFLTWFSAVACGTSKADCTCAANNNGVRRVLACGESSCVGGVVVACGGDGETALRGVCTDTPQPPAPPSDDDAGAGTPPPDTTACDDLAFYCTTSCSNPPDVAADCQATASSKDAGRCAAWPSTNALLCKP